MAVAPEEVQAWKERQYAVSAHMLKVHKRWGGQRPFDPKEAAAYDLDYEALLKDYEQFRAMPDEVWDELFAEDDLNTVA